MNAGIELVGPGPGPGTRIGIDLTPRRFCVRVFNQLCGTRVPSFLLVTMPRRCESRLKIVDNSPHWNGLQFVARVYRHDTERLRVR